MQAPQKKPDTRFEECESFDDGKALYRKELLRCHPDQGGSNDELIKLRKEFDSWVSRKAWEARQSGASFRNGGGPGGGPGGMGGVGHQPRSNDPEDYLSIRTKEVLREVIESGLNCTIEIVGSFIWLDQVSPGDFLTLSAWGFTLSHKYNNRWFWADFDDMKKKGNLPRGKFNGNFEDMKKLHRNKVAKDKQFLAAPVQVEEEEEP